MLVPIEFTDLPFVPLRMFSVNNVPAGSVRGGHAHHRTRQYLLCLAGKIRVLTIDANGKHEYTIAAGQGTLIENLTWDSQQFITGHEQLIVLCSTRYDKNDYIMDFEKFKRLIRSAGSK